MINTMILARLRYHALLACCPEKLANKWDKFLKDYEKKRGVAKGNGDSIYAGREVGGMDVGDVRAEMDAVLISEYVLHIN